ncbi:MAG TPA: YeeE/YedE family protein [Hyphomicrobiaceae bacterium]|nr:YeeE/YedE family protein [Hyphomicrobiaceae bacterium]
MQALRDIITQDGPIWLALGGFLIGALFGAVVLATNYCAMGSLSDIHNFGDWRRFRAWLLAAATALVGAQLLDAAGVVALDKSMYLVGAGLNWAGHVLGGLVFGFGMVFTGGCPSRNLARAGAGDLRSLTTLIVLGIVAYATIGGILAPARAALEQVTSLPLASAYQSLGAAVGAGVGLAPSAASLLVTTAIAAGVLVYCLRDKAFRSSPVHILSGLLVGLLVVAGWGLTGLTYDDMAARPLPPISLTYVRPAGDVLQWLMLYTATPMPGFGAASVLGALVGAFAAALATGKFRLATFADAGDTVRNLAGAALMGIGGVMALGCTVGQAVTGVSTLALGSFLTFAAIVAGGFIGLRVLERIA